MEWKFWKQRRYIVSLMAFLALFNVFSMSTNLSVAILGMTEIQYYELKNGTIVKVQDFKWDVRMQGLILSSYYYGNLCTYIIGGWLATRYGGATIIVLSAMFSAELSFGTPEISKMNDYAIVALRICLGCAQGVVMPCINVLWTKWSPVSERSSMSSFAMSGCFVGTVCIVAAAGTITELFGWAAVFYITGWFSLFIAICFGKNVKNDPSTDPKITKEELTFIQESIGTYDHKIKIPWLTFLTSKPVWAVFVAHFCANWGLYTLLTQFPLFLFETTDYNINCIGFVSALPYLANAIVLQFSGRLADKAGESSRFSLTAVRKCFVCAAFIGQMIFIVMAGLIHVPVVILVCVIIATSFDALAWSCFGVNFLDIATPYAGVLMGISSTLAILPGIITPLLTGELITDRHDYQQWRYVFLLCGAVYLFGAIFYGIFGSAELQSWALTHIEFRSASDEDINDETASVRSHRTSHDSLRFSLPVR